jgi:hypothetical protein
VIAFADAATTMRNIVVRRASLQEVAAQLDEAAAQKSGAAAKLGAARDAHLRLLGAVDLGEAAPAELEASKAAIAELRVDASAPDVSADREANAAEVATLEAEFREAVQAAVGAVVTDMVGQHREAVQRAVKTRAVLDGLLAEAGTAADWATGGRRDLAFVHELVASALRTTGTEVDNLERQIHETKRAAADWLAKFPSDPAAPPPRIS